MTRRRRDKQKRHLRVNSQSTIWLSIAAAFAPAAARAQDNATYMGARIAENQELVGLGFVVTLVLIAAVTMVLHITGREQWKVREAALIGENASLRANLDRTGVFLQAEPQVIVAWGTSSGEPDIEGDISIVSDTPVPRRVLGFGSWLAPEAAQEFEGVVDRLRRRGEGFRVALTSLSGRHLEAEGRAISGRAVLRIKDVSGDRLELARLRERHSRALLELGSLKSLLDAAPQATWMRDREDRLIWVNASYVAAVEATDAADAVARGLELLDRGARDASRAVRASASTFRNKTPAVVAGSRSLLDVIELPAPIGSAGQAADLSEIEEMRANLTLQMDAHTRTLDLLSTAVAIFDRGRRLVFHNAAYRQLWSLDPAFLDQRPTDSEILDRLRAEHRLEEQADFRAWKATLLKTYQSLEPIEQVWHLPDTRTLRTVINPNPQGGLTYLFDDLSERFQLASRYNSLFRVQTETLNTLSEGVAVFGSDGRLKLSNSALERIWQVSAEQLGGQPHIDEIASLFSNLHSDQSTWDELRSVVAGLHDTRTGSVLRLKRDNGTTLDCHVSPLPDGAVLLTFSDVTAAEQFQSALEDRNKALMDAEKLRNDFVQHVSYELRSPLTNIIGFIDLLTDGAAGPLNEKQMEYTGYVLQSSAALLAIINDILDLASIDAGAMELSLSDVDIRSTIDGAAQGLRDRLTESAIQLRIVASDDIGSFRADGKRLRQILFNLLSNAIGFSAPGQTVTLAALRRDDRIVFKVTDQGRGIPPDQIDRVFGRFESNTNGSQHRGAGLGLSIVREFVGLLGGETHIQSAPGEGTTVTCEFPVARSDSQRKTEVA